MPSASSLAPDSFFRSQRWHPQWKSSASQCTGGTSLNIPGHIGVRMFSTADTHHDYPVKMCAAKHQQQDHPSHSSSSDLAASEAAGPLFNVVGAWHDSRAANSVILIARDAVLGREDTSPSQWPRFQARLAFFRCKCGDVNIQDSWDGNAQITHATQD